MHFVSLLKDILLCVIYFISKCLHLWRVFKMSRIIFLSVALYFPGKRGGCFEAHPYEFRRKAESRCVICQSASNWNGTSITDIYSAARLAGKCGDDVK